MTTEELWKMCHQDSSVKRHFLGRVSACSEGIVHAVLNDSEDEDKEHYVSLDVNLFASKEEIKEGDEIRVELVSKEGKTFLEYTHTPAPPLTDEQIDKMSNYMDYAD